MKKMLLLFLSILTIAVLFIACDPGLPTGASEYIISGIVRDSVTGTAVSGAKVGFGQNILTTDVTGAYSVTVAANTAMTGNFYVSKGTEYYFQLFSGLNLTPVSDLNYDLIIPPVDDSAYTTHTISGKIYETNGTTEIPHDSGLDITIFNEDGGRYSLFSRYTNPGTGYSIDTKTFGTNCVIFIAVDDGATDYFYYIENVDLSAATLTLDFTKPSSGYSTVTVTGVNNDGFFAFMEYSPSISVLQLNNGIGPSTTTNVQIYNPDSKNFYWVTMTSLSDTPLLNDATDNYSFSTSGVPGAAVTLLVSSISAPTAAVLGSSINYTAGSFSFTDTGSADLFALTLTPDEGDYNGNILSLTNPIDLPADIAAILTSGADTWTNWDAEVTSVNFLGGLSLDNFMDFYLNGGAAGDEYAMVNGDPAASTSVDLIPSN